MEYLYLGNLSSDRPHQLETEVNQAFEQYRQMHYESGVSSVYFWDLENSFASVILIKMLVMIVQKKVKGCWVSIRVVEVITRKTKWSFSIL